MKRHRSKVAPYLGSVEVMGDDYSLIENWAPENPLDFFINIRIEIGLTNTEDTIVAYGSACTTATKAGKEQSWLKAVSYGKIIELPLFDPALITAEIESIFTREFYHSTNELLRDVSSQFVLEENVAEYFGKPRSN